MITWTNITVRLGDLKPWSDNPRLSTKKQAQKILDSWKKFGQTDLVKVSPDLDVYDGHQRLSALLTIHNQDHVIEARQSSRHLTEAERREFVITHHAGAVGSWDWNELSNWQPAELLEWGFDDSLLTNWRLDVASLGNFLESEEAGEGGDAEPQISRADELQKEWGTAVGQLWAIGEHRLICGDCTDRAVVDRLIGGDVPLLMVTDPPYGVEYEGKKGTVVNDDRSDWSAAYDLFPGRVAYVWHGERTSLDFGINLRDCGFDIRARIIWVKSSPTFSRGHYHYQHEGAWYAVKRGARSLWCGDHNQSTVWNFDRDDHQHPTVKPLECMARPIRNHDAPIVYDPFGGSGTTMVACQNLGRRCFMIELDPGYTAVILQRMVDAFPGITAELIDTI